MGNFLCSETFALGREVLLMSRGVNLIYWDFSKQTTDQYNLIQSRRLLNDAVQYDTARYNEM